MEKKQRYFEYQQQKKKDIFMENIFHYALKLNWTLILTAGLLLQ